MAGLAPLAMSQTKDDLLRHLKMAPETYSMMAKEADRYYKWLTQERRHLKKNCKRKPPYDWSDINEKSKDEAMVLIAQSGDAHTSYYWNLAVPSDDCPNWIARWFLYHKFRYRDGRNRNAPSQGGESSHHHSSHHSRHKHSSGGESGSQYYTNPSSSSSSYYQSGSMVSGSQPYYTSTEASSSGYSAYDAAAYPSSSSYTTPSGQGYEEDDAQNSKSYYDPVRDASRDHL